MTSEHKQAFYEMFVFIYKGNKDAIGLSFALLQVLHVWDDLIDADDVITQDDIHTAFVNALINIGGHPLWDRAMAANMLNVYYRWRDANTIEADPTSTDNDLAKAWMLRAGCYDLFVCLAGKLHGIEWAITIGPTVRKTYGETLQDFIQEMRQCQTR